MERSSYFPLGVRLSDSHAVVLSLQRVILALACQSRRVVYFLSRDRARAIMLALCRYLLPLLVTLRLTLRRLVLLLVVTLNRRLGDQWDR